MLSAATLLCQPLTTTRVVRLLPGLHNFTQTAPAPTLPHANPPDPTITVRSSNLHFTRNRALHTARAAAHSIVPPVPCYEIARDWRIRVQLQQKPGPNDPDPTQNLRNQGYDEYKTLKKKDPLRHFPSITVLKGPVAIPVRASP
ncbi:hypothetical protein CcaCcLH18_03766 [Colletotrichum camelliae]|nr:hypothetical protein CcaCcLH18_03766 [Colletotrichum camelliae]